jgi:cytochrome c biogenesis protein CcdA
MDPATLTVALVAGAVAAVNPCGFALLPAYVTLAVTGDVRGAVPASGRLRALGRAARFTLGMAVGFVVVFGAFALLVAPVAAGVQRWLPYLTVVLGIGLVVAGGWLVSGRELPGLPRLRVPTGRPGSATEAGLGSSAVYGVTFALASLSCTVAPFLAVVTRSLQGGPAVAAAAMAVYALGMAAVVGVVAISVALAQAQVVAGMRRVAPVLPRVAGVLVLVAGAYVTWYGWYEIRVLEGIREGGDPVVDAATAVQSAISRCIAALGPAVLATVAAIVLVVMTVALTVRLVPRRRGRRGVHDAGASERTIGPTRRGQ